MFKQRHDLWLPCGTIIVFTGTIKCCHLSSLNPSPFLSRPHTQTCLNYSFEILSLPTYTICYNKRDEGDVGEDTSKNLPRKAQARNAFTPWRGFISFTLIATCWHFSSLKFHSLYSWLEFKKPFCFYCFTLQLMLGKCGETQNTFHISCHPRLRQKEGGKTWQYWIFTPIILCSVYFFFNLHLNFHTSTSYFQFLQEMGVTTICWKSLTMWSKNLINNVYIAHFYMSQVSFLW